ncbi:MAG: hypothetical protein GY768_02460 [Planctomycetaceae bacterium]|nr:hypothetical protein [Planctomycetaceae bacterium]
MGASQTPNFGFITVTDLGGAARIGGYLILNTMGRPLEFHCTAPVKPNRAQEILYGATLDSYLHGEQIGQALIANGQVQPDLIFTDRPSVLSLREFSQFPVVCLWDSDRRLPDGETMADPNQVSCLADGFSLRCDVRHQAETDTIRSMVESRQAKWDLWEPFERITDAVSELQKAA